MTCEAHAKPRNGAVATPFFVPARCQTPTGAGRTPAEKRCRINMGDAVFQGGMARGLARLAVPVLSLALLSGCSLLSVGYSQIDTYAGWKADEYFDLDSRQKQEFRTRFDRLHEWHRYQQLPDYAAFLGSAGGRIQKGVTHEDTMWIAQGIEERYRVLVRRGSDDAAALLVTITPAQLEALQRRWEKDNARYVREYRVNGTVEEQRQARTERELKRVREWVGDLPPEQEKKIASLAHDLPLAPKLRYEDRLRRQREFLQLMEQRSGDARQFSSRLNHWLLNWEEGRSPEYQRFFTDWRLKQTEFYVAVERTLTPQQRTSLLLRVQRYADDFTRLARRPEAQAASR